MLRIWGDRHGRIDMLSATGSSLGVFGKFDWINSMAAPPRISELGQMVVGAGGDLYVVAAGQNRVEHISASGRVLRRWGGFGPGPGQFHGPTGVAIDQLGRVYVSDSGSDRIELLQGSQRVPAQSERTSSTGDS